MGFLERLAPAYATTGGSSRPGLHLPRGGSLRDSRRLSERSLAQYPGNANASHNLAHIYFETLDTDAGAAFLDEWMRDYDARASFHCHLAWHQAMFAVHQGRYARALDIFERDIVGAVNPRLAMIDGSALLWRFRLDGEERARRRRWGGVAGRPARPGVAPRLRLRGGHAALAYAPAATTSLWPG